MTGNRVDHCKSQWSMPKSVFITPTVKEKHCHLCVLHSPSDHFRCGTIQCGGAETAQSKSFVITNHEDARPQIVLAYTHTLPFACVRWSWKHCRDLNPGRRPAGPCRASVALRDKAEGFSVLCLKQSNIRVTHAWRTSLSTRSDPLG